MPLQIYKPFREKNGNKEIKEAGGETKRGRKEEWKSFKRKNEINENKEK